MAVGYRARALTGPSHKSYYTYFTHSVGTTHVESGTLFYNRNSIYTK